MTIDLKQLLEETPDPPRPLDPGTVLQAARRRRRERRALGGVAAVVLVVVGGGGLLALDGDTDRVQPARPVTVPAPVQVPLVLSVLERRVPVDDVGPFLPNGPARTVDEDPLDTAQLRLAHPGEASLVLSTPHGTEYYLAESTDGVLCLAWVAEVGDQASGCLSPSTLLTTGFVMPINNAMGADETDILSGVVVVVPDGYDRVTSDQTSAAVGDNVALVPVDGDDLPARLTLTGPVVPDVVLRSPYCPAPGEGIAQCPDDRPTAPLARVAQWRLAAAPRPGDTTLSLLVTEWSCSGGRSAAGRIPEPVVEDGPDAVTITVRVTQLGGAQACPGNPETPYVVQLDEPLGSRALLDGGVVPAAPVQVPAP